MSRKEFRTRSLSQPTPAGKGSDLIDSLFFHETPGLVVFELPGMVEYCGETPPRGDRKLTVTRSRGPSIKGECSEFFSQHPGKTIPQYFIVGSLTMQWESNQQMSASKVSADSVGIFLVSNQTRYRAAGIIALANLQVCHRLQTRRTPGARCVFFIAGLRTFPRIA